MALRGMPSAVLYFVCFGLSVIGLGIGVGVQVALFADLPVPEPVVVTMSGILLFVPGLFAVGRRAHMARVRGVPGLRGALTGVPVRLRPLAALLMAYSVVAMLLWPLWGGPGGDIGAFSCLWILWCSLCAAIFSPLGLVERNTAAS